MKGVFYWKDVDGTRKAINLASVAFVNSNAHGAQVVLAGVTSGCGEVTVPNPDGAKLLDMFEKAPITVAYIRCKK